MVILLDTHALLFLSDRDLGPLKPGTLAAVNSADKVLVSAISFYEIGWKFNIGKLNFSDQKLRDLPDLLQEANAVTVPVSDDISIEAALMDWSHRDPFDRIIVATARLHDCKILSKDTAIKDFEPERTLW